MEGQIRVRFLTSDESIRVTDTPFAVPCDVSRRGLSNIINHLLNRTVVTPFDFLIDNKFLRCTLEKYMKNNQVSEEQVLTIEYLLAMEHPEQSESKDAPNWISAVHTFQSYIVSGCYDGVLRVYNNEGVLLASKKAHVGAIKAVEMSEHGDSSLWVVTGGKDNALKTWTFDTVEHELTSEEVSDHHSNSVECVHVKDRYFVSGAWDNVVRLYERKRDKGCSTKKRRVGENSEQTCSAMDEPIVRAVGHTGCVSGVAIGSDFMVSASWDRCVKVWDLETNTCKDTLTGNRPIADMSMSVVNENHIATAHQDHCVRIWDPRTTGEAAVKMSLKSHQKWVSTVEWHPEQEHILLSGDYEGALKVWDIRSSIPMYTIAAHEGKILDAAWLNTKVLVSGKLHKLFVLCS